MLVRREAGQPACVPAARRAEGGDAATNEHTWARMPALSPVSKRGGLTATSVPHRGATLRCHRPTPMTGALATLSPLQRLKLRVMTDGLTVTPEARARLSGGAARPLTLADYATTSGISLRLGRDVWVNAPIAEHNPNFVDSPPHMLDVAGEAYVVRTDDFEVDAHPLPVPDYHDRTNRWGEAYTSYAYTHTDRVRISPIEGCSVVCKFCDLPYEYRYRTKRTEGLIDAITTALGDQALPAKHVLVSGGTPRAEDFGYLNDVYARVAEAHRGIPVDVMMMPAPGLLDVDRLATDGINFLSINLEIFNAERAAHVMPAKAKLGRQHVLDFIERAVARFGPGRVRSLLLVGIEPREDTLAGVAALAARGCEPVLSPFRPDPSTPMRGESPPSAELLAETYLRSVDIVERLGAKLGPRCIPCMHNTLTFPDDSGYYFGS